MQIKTDPKPIRLLYFYLGILATFAYRIIIVLNFYEPILVKVAWYVGTIGFIIYFWSRYKVVNQFHTLIRQQKLVQALKTPCTLTQDQQKALAHIVETLNTTKAQLNYVIIFILSFLALIAGIILDLLG
jgi:hypothetical protein